MEPTVPAGSAPSSVRPLESRRPTGERPVNSGLRRWHVPGAAHRVALGLEHPDRTLLHPVVAELHAVATEVVEEVLHHVAVGAEHDVAVLHLLEQSQRLRRAGTFGERVGSLDVDAEATGERRDRLDAADVGAAQDQVDRLVCSELVDDAVGLRAADLRQGPQRVVALPRRGSRPGRGGRGRRSPGTGALARSLRSCAYERRSAASATVHQRTSSTSSLGTNARPSPTSGLHEPVVHDLVPALRVAVAGPSRGRAEAAA